MIRWKQEVGTKKVSEKCKVIKRKRRKIQMEGGEKGKREADGDVGDEERLKRKR